MRWHGHPVAYLGNAVALVAFAYVVRDASVVAAAALVGALLVVVAVVVEVSRRKRQG